MKIKKLLALILALAITAATLVGCGLVVVDDPVTTDEQGNEIITDKNGETVKGTTSTKKNNGSNNNNKNNNNNGSTVVPDESIDGVGTDLGEIGINDGRFNGSTSSADFAVECVSGTKNAYTYDDTSKTLTFTALSENSVYSISGKLNGNIVIDAGDNYKLELELTGFSLRSSNANPIFAKSGNEVKITAKKDTKNYIYDERSAVDTTQSGVYGGSVHAVVDLEIRGRGELFVQSANNNGIQTTKDLQVKNLSLVVECQDNALKGKDSVTVENCSTLLVAKSGDAIKTEATDISSSTGKQRGTVSILGGTHNLFAANDGIDAAYDVVIDNGSYIDDATQKEVIVATVVNIYTDSYSNYTSGNSGNNSSSNTNSADTLYICYTSNNYKYSVKLLNNDASKSEWVNPTYDKSVQSGRSTYYTYKFNKGAEYTKMQLYIYTSSQTQQNETSYYYKTDVISIHNEYNTYRYSSSKRSWSWVDYSSLSQGGGFGGPGGGPNDGNQNKLEYSAKGIKGANTITINAGTITIKAPDDAIHADNTTTLENGQSPKGNLTVNGGDITVTTKDDGLHADGALLITGGSVNVLSSYEGVEGNTVTVKGGSVSVVSSDDGFNSGATSGTGITISGGNVYVYASGDGIDSNSRASYNAIAFTGGNTVIISTSGGNSAIDSDGGYKYTGGKVLAIMPSNAMTSESKHCSNFSSIGKAQSVSLSANGYATVTVGGSVSVSVKMPKAMSALAIYLGSSSASITSASSSAGSADSNGVYWAN